jgi:hypothetical protein
MVLVLFAGAVTFATSAPAQAQKKTAPKKASAAAPPAPVLEDKAIEILKASSSRLAAARTLSFTAVATYENPSRQGYPIAYTTSSEVLVERPNKLRVLTAGDGPASDFYYDGATATAFAPAENLAATAKVAPTIDGMLEEAHANAAIYFPFADVIVADPYQDMAQELRRAYYVGQSKVVGGTTTDIVVYDAGGVLVQAWIGAEDKLPRRLRAVYASDPLMLRHDLEMSNWKIDPAVASDAFVCSAAAAAKPMPFARPDPVLPAKAPKKPASGAPTKGSGQKGPQ